MANWFSSIIAAIMAFFTAIWGMFLPGMQPGQPTDPTTPVIEISALSSVDPTTLPFVSAGQKAETTGRYRDSAGNVAYIPKGKVCLRRSQNHED